MYSRLITSYRECMRYLNEGVPKEEELFFHGQFSQVLDELMDKFPNESVPIEELDDELCDLAAFDIEDYRDVLAKISSLLSSKNVIKSQQPDQKRQGFRSKKPPIIKTTEPYARPETPLPSEQTTQDDGYTSEVDTSPPIPPSPREPLSTQSDARSEAKLQRAEVTITDFESARKTLLNKELRLLGPKVYISKEELDEAKEWSKKQVTTLKKVRTPQGVRRTEAYRTGVVVTKSMTRRLQLGVHSPNYLARLFTRGNMQPTPDMIDKAKQEREADEEIRQKAVEDNLRRNGHR